MDNAPCKGERTITEEDIVGLGYWCETTLGSEMFATIVQQFEQQCFNHWVYTDPKNSKERDYIFAKMRALGDFIGHLKSYVVHKDEIVTRDAPSQEDAPIEGIDY
jgi:hypothetical protein